MSTPRYGHAPITMVHVAYSDHINCVGKFAWSYDRNGRGHKYITIALPTSFSESYYVFTMRHFPVNRPRSGWKWDGDEDKPTFKPSIHCVGHWKGYVQNGFLIEAGSLRVYLGEATHAKNNR